MLRPLILGLTDTVSPPPMITLVGALAGVRYFGLLGILAIRVRETFRMRPDAQLVFDFPGGIEDRQLRTAFLRGDQVKNWITGSDVGLKVHVVICRSILRVRLAAFPAGQNTAAALNAGFRKV